MTLKKVFAPLLLLLLTSCAGYTPPTVTPERYPGSYSTREVDISWRIERKPEVLTVDGVARNRFLYPLLDFDLSARLMDATGKRLGNDAHHGFPGQVSPGQSDEFTLRFPLAPTDAPARLEYTIRYHVLDDNQHDIPFVQTFQADLR